MPRKPPDETPLYVKLPHDAIDRLQRAADALGMRKKDLVASLVTKYVDPDDAQALSTLGAPLLGKYSFQAYDPPAVLNAEQAAQLLQIEEALVIELAEAGKLPGKQLGRAWRFSRDALVAWLSTAGTD